ncbi:MAG: KilA-N domain-containing protein, partial [Bacteroidales bacterium]
TEEDLIVSSQKTGTWMHRILAMKFAAWLSPAFEFWIYSVIDELLFGHYREMEEMLLRSAETRNRIDSLKEQLREDDRFAELENLEVLYKQYLRNRSRKTTNQLELFCSIAK